MRRSGFTVLELMVSISLAAALVALVMPAIQSARETSRRIQCANNMKQISLGLLMKMDTKREFPPASVWRDSAEHESWDYRNWVVDILPMLDRKDLSDRWTHEEPLGNHENQAVARTHVNVLVCPSDVSATGAGDLSYALNRGPGPWLRDALRDCDTIYDALSWAMDLNGDGRSCALRENSDGQTDLAIYRRLTLFFDARARLEPIFRKGMSTHHNAADVTDGLSNTLMVAENAMTGADATAKNANWASTDWYRTGVFFSSNICVDRICTAENVHLDRANSGVLRINGGLTRAEGDAPWPNSFHKGGVNISRADGSVQFLAEVIDGAVYFDLYTPQGSLLSNTALRQD